MFFVKKWKMGGCKKVKNKCVFFCKKSGKWGVFFVKSGPFLNAGCIMYSISIFLHFTYLGVRTQPTHPTPCDGPAYW